MRFIITQEKEHKDKNCILFLQITKKKSQFKRRKDTRKQTHTKNKELIFSRCEKRRWFKLQ